MLKPSFPVLIEPWPSYLQIKEIKQADIPDVNLSELGVHKFGDFSVEVIDPVADYLNLLEVWFINFSWKTHLSCTITVAYQVFWIEQVLIEIVSWGWLTDVSDIAHLTTHGSYLTAHIKAFSVLIELPCLYLSRTLLQYWQEVFDFDLLKGLLTSKDFRFVSLWPITMNTFWGVCDLLQLSLNFSVSPSFRYTDNSPPHRFKFDAMHAVTGAYAKPIFVDRLGAPEVGIPILPILPILMTKILWI